MDAISNDSGYQTDLESQNPIILNFEIANESTQNNCCKNSVQSIINWFLDLLTAICL